MPTYEAEQLVCNLPDVSACRIQANAMGRPLSVHVTTRSGRAPWEVAHDVVTLLAAEAHMDIHPGQVHVVSLGSESDDAPPPPPAPETETTPEVENEAIVLEELEHEVRARLLTWSTRVSEERSVAEVELGLGTLSALGRAEARGAGTAPDLVAQACLDALEKLCASRVSLRLVAMDSVRMGSVELTTCLVQETEGRNETLHTGVARVEGDYARAAIYAVLSSMNRRLGRILAGPPRDYEIS